MRYKFILIFILVVTALGGIVAQDIIDDYEIAFVTGYAWSEIAITSSNGIETVFSDDIYQLRSPQWSFDGREIAFASQYDIYIVNADTKEWSKLMSVDDSETISNIYWLSDGKTIASSIYKENNSLREWLIRFIDIESLEITDFSIPMTIQGSISFSPDEQFIAFTSNQDSQGDGSGLYILSLETGNIQALTDESVYYRDARYPSWSPNGNEIAFISFNDDGTGWDIYRINIDGSNLRRFTTPENAPNTSGYINSSVDWSSDGNKIVFSACRPFDFEDCELYTINTDGTQFAQLTNLEGQGAFYPNWKP